jgi:hypothetical protein
MLIVATFGTLFLLEPVEQEPLDPEAYYTMTATELKAELAKRMGEQRNRKIIFSVVIAVLICVVPMGRTTRLTRWLILVGIGLIGRFVMGDQVGPMSSMTKMCILGGMMIATLIVVKLYNKAVDNGKRPASERWAPRRTKPVMKDDPETLAKLDRLRVVATTGPPPTMS